MNNLPIKRIAVDLKILNEAFDNHDGDVIYVEMDLLLPLGHRSYPMVIKHEFVLSGQFDQFIKQISSGISVEYFNRDKSPNPIAECSVCGIRGKRIFRFAASSYLDCRCNNCIEAGKHLYYVPCIYDTDGSVWGFTSVPEIDVARFLALPESNFTKKMWSRKNGFK